MTETKHRRPQFALWSIFVLTTVAALISAAGSGVIGKDAEFITRIVLGGACFASLSVIVIVPPLVLLVVGMDRLGHMLFDRKRKS